MPAVFIMYIHMQHDNIYLFKCVVYLIAIITVKITVNITYLSISPIP